jgi:acetyl esterase/lipase/lysophospholipase L1-like esterase
MKKILLLCLLSSFAFGQEVINLYDGTAPGSEHWNWKEGQTTFSDPNNRIIYNVSKPTITAYLPEKNKSTGTAILIAPGGGFHLLSMDSEGYKVAEYLQSKGVAAFVLKYRLGQLKTDNPQKELNDLMGNPQKMGEAIKAILPLEISDAQSAIKHIRENANKYDIDPSKVGMMGFSAGGTLTLGTIYLADEKSRPNFIAPIYPYTEAVAGFKHMPKEKTPIFIAVASDDGFGFAKPNAELYLDWLAAKQPAELHIYEKGGHGFGMNKQKLPSDTWNERFGDWLNMQGYLTKRHPSDFEKNHTAKELEAIRLQNEERSRRDFAALWRYRDANIQIKESKKNPKVVFTGDSITDGWIRSDPDYWEDNNYADRGISGQTSPQTLLRFQPDVVALNPQAVIINIGINDIAENTGDYLESYVLGNYSSMVATAKAEGIIPILASVMPAYEFPWNKEIKNVPAKVISLNEGIKKLADENNLVYLDYFNALKDERNGLSSEMAKDGVHPTLACYKIMEDLADDAIRRALGE